MRLPKAEAAPPPPGLPYSTTKIMRQPLANDAHNRPPSTFEHIHEDHHEERQPLGIEQLVQQIRETADKLVRDNATRGDVKLLSTALRELRYCFKVFSAFRNVRKVTVFGSARLPPTDPSYKQAVEFGRRMAAAGYMVITGAASGIMEAGNIGAGQDKSFGVNIMLPFEQEANSIVRGDLKLMHLKYFFTRKLLFVKEADAVALFPGGFGTQDEGFEVLTLVQTGKSHLFPIVMVDEPGGDYWHRWREFIADVLLKRKLISPADMSLFKVTNSVEEAVSEILTFYRAYHSMRYVGRELALRLKYWLPDELMKQIGEEFADIIVTGGFQQTKALPAEANDTQVADLPRLVFHFDRRNLGRLRLLVDLINQEGVKGKPATS
jgi:uncharacterized protein (TIGR00730 family)